MDDCVFCNHHLLPAQRELITVPSGPDFYDVMVFEPLNPVVPGHLLVVPDDHVADATEDLLVSAAAMRVASRIAQRMESANIITSIGAPATQTVKHLHLHVVPRFPGDGLKLPWST